MINFRDWMKTRKIQEMGVGPYIGNCVDTDDYQVIGACSDQNSKKKNNDYKKGNIVHKKTRSNQKSIYKT
jgi:hypothetical protein